MMKFRTEIDHPSYPFKILPQTNMLFLGSCFAENFGNFFQQRGANALVNPFGTLYNPASVATAVKLLRDPQKLTEDYFYYFNNQWISFAHSTKFSHPDKSLFIENLSCQLNEASDFLRKTDLVFITLGTAFVYEFIPRNLLVANCHKIPNTQFHKRMLRVEDATFQLETLSSHLLSVKPDLKIIFTISPIRHLSDGFHQNQLSKSTLHLAVNQFVDNKSIFYFPAYEIVMDDLRDYRFYTDDLCHIASNAVEYIQTILLNSMCAPETIISLQQGEKEWKQKNHRPIQSKL